MLDSLLRLALKKQAQVSEMLVSGVMFFWGMWLLNPYWETFALSVFAGFPQFGSEEIWGAVYGVVGLLGILASMTKVYKLRKTVVFIQIMMWAFVATAFLMSTPETTAVPVYFMLSIICFWLYIKLLFFELAHSEIMTDLRKRH